MVRSFLFRPRRKIALAPAASAGVGAADALVSLQVSLVLARFGGVRGAWWDMQGPVPLGR